MSIACREFDPSSVESAVFARYLRTGRRTTPMEVKFNSNHDRDTGRFTTSDNGAQGSARLTPQAQAFVDAIDHDFHLRTGKHLHVNSGTRDAAAQADAMVNKGPADWSIYKDKQALGEIRAAFDRSRAGGADEAGQKKAVADVIRQQMAQGHYISNHLVSRAVDLRIKGYSPADESLMKELARKHGATKILYESKPRHLHMQF